MTDGQSTSSCGCVWERTDEHEVIVVSCVAHRAGMIGGEIIGNVEDRARWALDQELDMLVAEACQGRKLERIRPVDHTKR